MLHHHPSSGRCNKRAKRALPSPEKSQTLQYPNLGPGCSAAHTNSNSPQSGHFLSVTPSSMRMNGTLAPPSARCFGVSHCHCKEKATHSLLIGSGQFAALSFTSEEVEAPHVCKVKKHYAFSKPKSAHFLALIFDTTFGAALGDLAPRSTGNGTGGACARGGEDPGLATEEPPRSRSGALEQRTGQASRPRALGPPEMHTSQYNQHTLLGPRQSVNCATHGLFIGRSPTMALKVRLYISPPKFGSQLVALNPKLQTNTGTINSATKVTIAISR